MSPINPDPTMNSDRKADTMLRGAALNTRPGTARALAILLAALAGCLLWAGAARADFSVQTAEATLTEADGTPATQAGAHPDLTTNFVFGTKEGAFGPVPDGSVREIKVDLPAGLVGNATAVPRCSEEEFSLNRRDTIVSPCPPSTQVGIITAKVAAAGTTTSPQAPVYNMIPSPGVPAEMAFSASGMEFHLRTEVRPDGGLTSTIVLPAQVATYESSLTLWGVPGAKVHDPQRGQYCTNFEAGQCSGGGTAGAGMTPFLTLPADCTEANPQITMDIDSWEHIGDFTHVAEPVGPWTGCGRLGFEPKLDITPDTTQAGEPSGYTFAVDVPQDQGALGLGTPALRSSRIVLPQGLTISPPSADGLQACSDAQLGLGSNDAPTCPAASTLGSIELETPNLADPMSGEIYLRPQTPTDLARIALVVHGSDVLLKIPGVVKPDPQTGQLVATFNDTPQQPFSSLKLHFNGGQRAALVNPSDCGPKSAHADFASWAGPAPAYDSSFAIDGNCEAASQFTPSLEAGTTNPVAGKSSPFTLRVTRPDAQQNIERIEATLPKGLLAKLKGVSLCGDNDAVSGNCPAASQVGTTTVGVGAGTNPLYVPQPGKAPTSVYLAGPYKGAPYSLVVKVPAQAGPFDLGTVAVRNGLYVDPTTTQVTAKSDPLPQILQGVPISYRDIRVDVDRPDFTLNPTSCDPMSVSSTITSAAGKTASPSTRFQVADCERLDFKPSLKLKVSGGTKRGAYPKLRAELQAKPGEANVGRVSVALPHSEFLAQEHIKTICTRVQFAADQCPAGSIYGFAKATTPLLDQPLEGPVYLRSSSNPLPDLVAALHGAIDVDLSGRIDSVNGGIRTSFDAIPDAPVSKFVLEMQGGKKSLLVNSRNLCAGVNRASVKMEGQNGKAHDFNPALGSSCGGKAKKKGK
jgi:hypothetical protein